MELQLIPHFKRQGNKHSFLKLIKEAGRWPEVDCMNLTGFSKATGKMPIYAFVAKREVVILLVDWRENPEEELADEDCFGEHAPIYFSSTNKRQSPVQKLNEFIRQYKQAMIEADVNLTYVWGVLLSNSIFINHDAMIPIWEMMDITVHHGYGPGAVPYIHYSFRYHRTALPQFRAFRLWCERHGYLPKDPCAFEDIDAEYDEMEFGLDADDNDFEFPLDDDDDDFLEDDNDDNNLPDEEEPDIALAQFPEGTMTMSQNNVVNVEILRPMTSPHEELDKLVGCQNIKSQISDLLQLTRYNTCMTSHYPKWKQHNVSLHAIFFGRPGTGKTTVCKIYGSLLKEAGALSKGHVVVCNRATFIGSSWGDEEKAIRQVLEMAKGGVLMIDEAYLLNSSHPNDPAKLILPLFMDILSNEDQRDIAIVLCGYKEPMQRLLDLNPGLASRFPNRFEFEDFSVKELMEISLRRISEYGYHFTRAGLQKYKSLLTEAYTVRDPNTWGNARFVANLLEHIYLLHAKRCMRNHRHQAIIRFFSITPSDIQPIDIPKEKKRIGF